MFNKGLKVSQADVVGTALRDCANSIQVISKVLEQEQNEICKEYMMAVLERNIAETALKAANQKLATVKEKMKVSTQRVKRLRDELAAVLVP